MIILSISVLTSPSPLTGIFFQRLIREAVSNRSVGDLAQLCDQVAELSRSELCTLQPVFFTHLNPDSLPAESTQYTAGNIELARWSFVGIIAIWDTMMTGSAGPAEAQRYFISAWLNRTAPWLAFFHNQFIMRRASYRPVNRKLAIKLVASMLTHGANVNKMLMTTPSLYRTIAELWLIAIKTKDQDVLFIPHALRDHVTPRDADRVTPLRSISAILTAACTVDQSFVTIILEVAGDIDTVASTALKYLRSLRSMAQYPAILSTSIHMVITGFSMCVMFIIRSGEHSAALREEYILRQSVKEIFLGLRVILPLLHHDATEGFEHMFRPPLGSVLHYFSTVFYNADHDGVSVFYQALRSHALESAVRMLQEDSSTPLIYDVDMNVWISDFLGILSHYAMYNKILTCALKHLNALSTAFAQTTRQSETVRKRWCMLERYVLAYNVFRSEEEMRRRPSTNAEGWLLRVSHGHRCCIFYSTYVPNSVTVLVSMTLPSCSVRDARWYATAQRSASVILGAVTIV